MKNACIGLLFVLLFHAGVWGHSVNVLIAKHVPRVNLSFSQNYAIVIGKNFYGPISSQNQLRLTSGADGIRLTVRNAQTKVHKNLGASKGPIFLVRSLGPGINFNWPKPLSSLKKQPLPPFLKWQQFPSQKGAFVSFRHRIYLVVDVDVMDFVDNQNFYILEDTNDLSRYAVSEFDVDSEGMLY